MSRVIFQLAAVVMVEALKKIEDFLVVFFRKALCVAHNGQRVVNIFLHQTFGHRFEHIFHGLSFVERFLCLFEFHHSEIVCPLLQQQNLRYRFAGGEPVFEFLDSLGN